jgi:hypothetical protein
MRSEICSNVLAAGMGPDRGEDVGHGIDSAETRSRDEPRRERRHAIDTDRKSRRAERLESAPESLGNT